MKIEDLELERLEEDNERRSTVFRPHEQQHLLHLLDSETGIPYRLPLCRILTRDAHLGGVED